MANTITVENGALCVPNDPIIPFIEGDGTGPDIWAASQLESRRSTATVAMVGGGWQKHPVADDSAGRRPKRCDRLGRSCVRDDAPTNGRKQRIAPAYAFNKGQYAGFVHSPFPESRIERATDTSPLISAI